jgi:hypothetical protein
MDCAWAMLNGAEPPSNVATSTPRTILWMFKTYSRSSRNSHIVLDVPLSGPTRVAP